MPCPYHSSQFHQLGWIFLFLKPHSSRYKNSIFVVVILHVFCLKTTQAARVWTQTDQKRGQVNVRNLGHYIMKSLIVYTGRQVMLGKNFSGVTYGKVTTEKNERERGG
jgi:hypothetical protein